MSSDKEIFALEDKRYAAMCSGDFAALEAMLHDELLYTHSSGLADTKGTWLASLRSGKTKYKSAACSDRKVRLAGDTALVSFPKILSSADSRDEAESAHHPARCLPSSICLGRLSPTYSSRNAGLKSRISFSAISSILL